jgi:aminoglycoside phosphotransferase family enzyme/predicted kinase
VSAAPPEPSWLADLQRREAWPAEAGDAGRVQRIDTHISHVFLTDTRAYKTRRPVRLSFLDFSSAEERLADCRREVLLNRRLAPDVYLGLAPILVDAPGAAARVGPVAETPSLDPAVVEHAVVMRRLAAGRDLRSMLERGEAGPGHIDRIAERLAAFHAAHGLGRPAPFASQQWLERTTAPACANTDALAEAPADLAPPPEIEEIRRLAAAFVRSRPDDFEARRRDGRIVDGHGDLHAEHVWFETDDAPPLMIDCLEFRDDFRCIDAASDVAFLAMDLAYRGRGDLGARFVRRYARERGDFHLFAVLDFFLSYRALVRAKVASLVARDPALAPAQREHAVTSVRRHLDLGLEFLKPKPPGKLLLACGTIGTGETTVAEALADDTGGVVLSSDRLRRDPEAPAPADRYSEASRRAVYDRLLAEARHVVVSGRTAILDATWSRRSWRAAALERAAELGTEAFLVETTAPRDEVIARLASREAAGNDASEAGPALYDAMLAEFEETSEWPAAQRARIDTSSPSWREEAAGIAARLASRGSIPNFRS